MGCQECGARKFVHSSHPSLNSSSPFIWQASLVRESENMVHDTTTRLERAAGELEDLIVCATLPLLLSKILLMRVTSEIR